MFYLCSYFTCVWHAFVLVVSLYFTGGHRIVPCVLPGCQCGNLCSTVFPGVCSALHQYYFVDKSLTWSDAQSHCRQYGGDLATVHGPENQTRLVELGRKYNSHLWIGLYDDVESWTWSLSENANYSGGEVEPWSWPWRGHEPNNVNGREGCVAINIATYNWVDVNCNVELLFFCFDNNTKGEALVEALVVE